MLYRVDRSIHLAAYSDMDIPMTYASFVSEWSHFFSPPGFFVLDSGFGR
jgi:hypothetical protein